MLNLQLLNLISIAVFCLILFFLIWRDRDNIERSSIVFMRRTKHGIDILDSIAGKFPRFWQLFSTLGIFVSFGAMAFILYYLFSNLIQLALVPSTQPALALVLPSPSTSSSLGPGYLAIPFWYWIISIASVVVAHETMHGIIGRNEGFSIKSVGWVILGIIPGAFVEPEGEEGVLPGQEGDKRGDQDKEEAESQGPWQQGSWISRLRVLAAGSFSNICLGAILLAVIFLATTGPFGNIPYEPRGVYNHEGVRVTAVENKSPAYRAGLTQGDIIKDIDSQRIMDSKQLARKLKDYQPGDSVLVTTANRTLSLELGEQPVFNYTYSPAPVDFVLARLESANSGTVQSYERANDFLVPESKLHRFYRWRWIANNYPSLRDRAKERMDQLEQEIREASKAYIGIYRKNYRTPRVDQLFLPLIGFLKGLIMFMMLINFGIGLANMLPIKPLDGGLMIETIQDRFLPQREKLTRYMSYITLGLIIIIFTLTVFNLL